MKISLVLEIGCLATTIAVGGCSVSRRSATSGPTVTGGGAVEVVFTNQERALVLGWFRDHRSSLPPGLAKRDRLPPGLEKQVRERGTLPPGLQKRTHPLPVELERQLHKLPAGYVRVVVGATVVLMNQSTHMVHDVIRDAVR